MAASADDRTGRLPQGVTRASVERAVARQVRSVLLAIQPVEEFGNPLLA
jgi:hypothetical protein